MFKSFLMKQLLKSKLKDMPSAEADKILAIVEKNPDFFVKIAGEIQEKIKAGKDQMQATIEVMKSHEAELKNIL
ncbi:MAG: hypothetical protein A2743_03925 [Candidatus Taylorbacteria bacterium RIFCSPHIGHO2_01_FULL_43_47]|nr:MAG: hypothetical protein A2743_03925 [Candidatus Taylorbacteria bacterium RIFCSPHIGHO2_01_FULL_43_47]